MSVSSADAASARHAPFPRHFHAPAPARMINPGTAHNQILAMPMVRASTRVADGTEKILAICCKESACAPKPPPEAALACDRPLENQNHPSPSSADSGA